MDEIENCLILLKEQKSKYQDALARAKETQRQIDEAKKRAGDVVTSQPRPHLTTLDSQRSPQESRENNLHQSPDVGVGPDPDVDMVDVCNGEQTADSAPEHLGNHQAGDGHAHDKERVFFKEFARRLIGCFLLSPPKAFEMTLNGFCVPLDLLDTLLMDNQAVLLQCLAEEVAVDALRRARAAGCMALLVHKARTPDGRDLLSLAVRFVDESGEPVERLIVVVEASASRETSAAHRLFDSFKQLWEKADVIWWGCLCGVSFEGCGVEGREFLRLLKEAVKQWIPELVDSAIPIEERIVLACYEEGAGWDAFFSTVDDFRDFFSVKSRFNRLKKICETTVTGAGWLTYEGSLWVMMYELSEDKQKLKCEIQESEPATKVRLEMLFDRLQDDKFKLRLSAMNSVFHALKEAGVGDGQGRPYPANLDFEALLIKLEGVSFKGSHATKLAADDHRCTMDEAKDVARRVLEACRRECAPYLHPLARLQANPFVKPRPHCKDFDEQFPLFRFELDWLMLQHGYWLSNLSPREVVGALLKGEIPGDFPTLRSVLVRALTVPLLPCGTPRARDALRDSARALSACPSDRLGAVIVLQQESAQDLVDLASTESFFEAVVHRLHERQPELGLQPGTGTA